MFRKVQISTLMGAASAAAMMSTASASNFNVPAGEMDAALRAYMSQSGVQLLVPDDLVKGIRTNGVKGELAPDTALNRLLQGTGLISHREDGAVVILRGERSEQITIPKMELAQAMPTRSAVETVTVTSSKLGGADVQSIPIAITALNQEQLTATQTAGGPDLVKQVPNLTFTKTNFTGYSIQIRGIGTQAISVTTDPAVAVAFNDQPFIRNHFFEQEFYDVAQVEVLRGPQGTLYGRNATAGVVNLTSAKPTDQFEAMASGEIGNYRQKRFEGMINLPIVDDRLDIRVAGEWTKRQGYTFNSLTNERVDGRDLWSGRVTIGWKPLENLQTYLVWEHFSEDDDRIRSSKQLCKRGPTVTEINGQPVIGGNTEFTRACLPASLYSSDSFGVPNADALPYYRPFVGILFTPLTRGIDPYASKVQSTNLRVIESSLKPTYKAKNDVLELNADYAVTPALTFTSQTAFNHDFLYSAEDFNRFNTNPGVFAYDPSQFRPGIVSPDGYYCDPQLGCANRLVGEDLSDEHAWQIGQEFRLASKFSGPLNFSIGGNYLHYETEENYYVFINSLTLVLANIGNNSPWIPGVSDNSECLNLGYPARGFRYPNPASGGTFGESCQTYIDPNPIDKLNNNGHNYFLSQNPYVLNSYAGFGEAYYNILPELKLTAGLRWTEDRKHFTEIPSWLFSIGWGYPITGVINQQWDELTGRAAVNWSPKLDFTDQTLIYGTYSHGYKAGGANPPGAMLLEGAALNPTHPETFKPEFVDAFEIGSKNTLLDSTLTLNASAFYYNYENY